MDGELEHEDSEVKHDTGRETPEDPYGERMNTSITLTENEKEGVPAELAESDHEESIKATKELPVEENSGNEPSGVNNISTSEHMKVKVSEVNEQPSSHVESVVFEIYSSDDHELHRLHLETPQRETTTPAQEEEEEEEESAADPADREHVSYEEYTQLLQELCEERDKATQRSSQLQMKLSEYLLKKAGDDTQLDKEVQVSEQLQEYEKYISILNELKQQLAAESEAVQQQEEELRLQSQDKLDKVGLIVDIFTYFIS